MSSKPGQIITDFKVGDIVRVTSESHWASVARDRGLGVPGTKHRVIGVLPIEHNPARTGDLLLEQAELGATYRRRVGHLLVDPPRPEDQPALEDALEDARLERDCALEVIATRDRQLATARDELIGAAITLQQLRSELEQQQAATVLEAHRANKAAAQARKLEQVLAYAETVVPKYVRGLINGYRDRLNQEV